VPRELLSDHGSDWAKGIRQFCQEHPEPCFVSDLKHKVATVLKRDLGQEPAWQEFSTLASQTIARVPPTALAALAPPRQRRKARYMNVGELVAWGGRILRYLDAPQSPQPDWAPPRVEHAVGWVRHSRQELEQWRQWMEVGTRTEQLGKTQGLSATSAPQLQQQLTGVGTGPRTHQMCTELLQLVSAEGAKAKEGERLVGSSEVIESIFGKWKRLAGDHPRRGLTGLVLALGAIVSPTTADVIKEALARVPTKTVLTWCRDKLGKTVQATRRTLFASPRTAEQKQDQLPLAA
jgi:hypothetical protein